MARQGVTSEQVFEAAEALMQEGQSVTVSSVRERIGSGSYSTISALVAQWKTANDHRKTADLPEMPASVENALRQVWALAWKATQERIKIQQDGLEAARLEMERETKAMASEIARLEAENLAQSETLKRQELQLAEQAHAHREAEHASNQLTLDNARLDERLKAAESANRLAEDNAKALAESEKTRQALAIENARLTERADAAEKNAAALRTELDKVHNHLQKLTEPSKPAKSGTRQKAGKDNDNS